MSCSGRAEGVVVRLAGRVPLPAIRPALPGGGGRSEDSREWRAGPGPGLLLRSGA